MTLREKQVLFTKNVALLLGYIFQQGYTVTLGEAFRTQEQAKIYFDQHKGILASLHCKRLAIDLNIFNRNGTYLKDSALYEPFGTYWNSLHPLNRWGGTFKMPDGNHFEMQDTC